MRCFEDGLMLKPFGVSVRRYFIHLYLHVSVIVIIWLIDWLIDFNGKSNRLGLLHAEEIREFRPLYIYIYLFV